MELSIEGLTTPTQTHQWKGPCYILTPWRTTLEKSRQKTTKAAKNEWHSLSHYPQIAPYLNNFLTIL